MVTNLDDIGTIYLLYDGYSEDGRGPAYYKGWTTDKAEAVAYDEKRRANPYCTGYVVVLTCNSESRL